MAKMMREMNNRLIPHEGLEADMTRSELWLSETL
jgi:hypothetical protein